MTTKKVTHRIIPVRFSFADLQKLEAKAQAFRLPIAAYVRMEIAAMLSKEGTTAE